MKNDKLKAIFIHIPKCGGTSVERFLQDFGFSCESHWHKTHSSFLINKKYKDYYTFSFVRNPFDKIVSEYKWFTNSTHKFPIKRVKEFYSGMSFKSFVKNFLNSNYGDHFHRFSYMQMLKPLEQMNFIGRFENFQKDFDLVCQNIGIPQGKLPHTYKTKHKNYIEYYDDETREIVAERYAKDIEHFGYKFGE